MNWTYGPRRGVCTVRKERELPKCICEGEEALTCVEIPRVDEGIVWTEVTDLNVCQLQFAQNTFLSMPSHLLQWGVRFDVFMQVPDVNHTGTTETNALHYLRIRTAAAPPLFKSPYLPAKIWLSASDSSGEAQTSRVTLAVWFIYIFHSRFWKMQTELTQLLGWGGCRSHPLRTLDPRLHHRLRIALAAACTTRNSFCSFIISGRRTAVSVWTVHSTTPSSANKNTDNAMH